MTIKEKLLEKMSAQCGQKITEINLISWSMIEPYINELEAQITKNRTFKPENKDYEQLEYNITPEMDEWMNAPMGKLVGCNNCYECLKDKMDESGLPTVVTRMILCPICGNKRCPKATDHNLGCTNSNKSGQPGSRY